MGTKIKKKPLWEKGIVSKNLDLLDYDVVCPWCGRKFIAHRKDEKWCSEVCYNQHYYYEVLHKKERPGAIS
jgi:hypothetical protein